MSSSLSRNNEKCWRLLRVQVIARLLKEAEAKQTMDYIDERASRGLRALAVAKSLDDGSTWDLVGLISLLDPPREDSAATIKEAQALGVEVSMSPAPNPPNLQPSLP